MEQPFFSVIVPAHNAEGFIRRGLDSIREQSFTDYELIIISDSCTDRTEQIAEEYADAVLLTDYGRGGMARNKGLDYATGKWILFMDDDDYYLPGAFERIAEALGRYQENEIDILAYAFEWDYIGTAIQNEKRIYPAVWNKAWRREFIGDTRFPDWVHTDDLAFARALHGKARIRFIPDVLYHYVFMRPGSLSDRIRRGEFDNGQLPGEYKEAADNYERWLKSKEFKK